MRPQGLAHRPWKIGQQRHPNVAQEAEQTETLGRLDRVLQSLGCTVKLAVGCCQFWFWACAVFAGLLIVGL